MRRSLVGIGLAFAGLAAYLFLAPIPAEPRAWKPPADAGYTGLFAPNQRLASVKRLSLGADHGPEHIALRDGWIYTGLASGAIVRLPADAAPGTQPQVLLNTGGRPLGLDFDNVGQLYIADGVKGLLRAQADSNGTWSFEPVATQVDDPEPGDPIRYADAVIAAPDGTIYFTDASRRFGPAQWGGTFRASVLDALEHSCTGRLLAYDPASGDTRVVVKDLCFPNGLALTPDASHILLSETGAYRILKIHPYLHGASARQALANPGSEPTISVLIDNLPGFPDNLMRGQDGRVWCGLVKPRSKQADQAAGLPWLRAMLMRLPEALWPVPKPYSAVFAFDDNGRVLFTLQDPKGGYQEVTALTEAGSRLYLHSLNAPAIGWIERQEAGF